MNHLTQSDYASALHQLSEAVLPNLTPREREVLQWLATGKMDTDIAALLEISPRTVQKHLEHIYVKLGVETRTAAVMRAMAMSTPRQAQGTVAQPIT
jgi:DNA-binding NarL/FixJ family response regulator